MADFQSKIADIKNDSSLLHQVQIREQELVKENAHLRKEVSHLTESQPNLMVLNTQIEQMGKEVIKYQSLCQELIHENDKLKQECTKTNSCLAKNELLLKDLF